MPDLITILAIICVAVMSVAHIWLIVAAFRTSVGWGFVTLLLPSLGNLLFMIFNWRNAAKPCFVYLGAFVCLLGCVFVQMAVAPQTTILDKRQTLPETVRNGAFKTHFKGKPSY